MLQLGKRLKRSRKRQTGSPKKEACNSLTCKPLKWTQLQSTQTNYASTPQDTHTCASNTKMGESGLALSMAVIWRVMATMTCIGGACILAYDQMRLARPCGGNAST